MKTKEQLTLDAGLVRDVEAWCSASCANDKERSFRDALFRCAFASLPSLEMPHVRRLNEALCALEFPSPTALSLREAVMLRLAVHHNLKNFRNVKMPVVLQQTSK